LNKGKYDVAIIGSGAGGMVAGTLLAHSGYKVLMVEALEKLGGRWSTNEINGFKCPTGAVLLHRGVLPDIFSTVGAQLEGVDAPEVFYRIEGKDYSMPPQGGFTAFLSIVNNLEHEKAKLVGVVAKEVAIEKLRGAIKQQKTEMQQSNPITLYEWLRQYTDNELALNIFDMISVAVMNARTFELPAYQFFQFMARMGGLRQQCVVNGGNIVAVNALADVIRRNGDVWTNCPATRIVVKDGKATGIVVKKDGHEIEIEARVVISDGGPKRTVQLAGEDAFGKEYVKTMNERLRPHPVTLINIGSDKPLILPEGQKAPVLVIGARRINSITPISNVCPDLAPKGMHLTYICAAPLRSLEHMNKPEMEKLVMEDIKELLPDFEKHGKILEMSSRDIDDEFPELRTWPGYDMPRETPIANLYNVGDGVKQPGITGTSAAAETGKIIVEVIKKLYKPGN
jgi:phytoene desaturase